MRIGRLTHHVVAIALGAWTGGSGSHPMRGDEVQDIVITEVMYNPASGDREEDFIELHNIGAEPYDLEGFRFTSGVEFTFPSVTLGPGAYLVVCANQARIRQLYGITNTVGDWNPETTLANNGERIRLVNAAEPPVEVEDFTFDDRNPWPILADGYGYSLERRNPLFDNDNPANWSASGVGSTWVRVTVNGLATSDTLYVYLAAAGTAYVDDVRIYPLGNPGDNRLANGGFEAGLSPWVPAGTHAGSAVTTEVARSGSHSLEIVATGAGSSQSTSVSQEGLTVVDGDPYTLEMYVYLPEPDTTLIARLSGSGGQAEPIYVETSGGGATPGRQNSVYATDIPPFVYPAGHSPSTPISTSQVTLLAVVWDDQGVASVTAHWDDGGGEETAAMLDDGLHGDGVEGDGLYGVTIGRFPTESIVRYWVTAQDTAGQTGRFPFEGNPTPTLGFYIEPPGIAPGFLARSNSGLESELPPVYHLLVDPSELDGGGHLRPDLRTYRRGTFIFNGEVFDNVRIRHRGQSSLGTPKKHWKVDFNKDHRFLTPFVDHPEVDNINLQSSYGDKTFLREWLSYKAMIEAGQPALEMWHVRMYLNGDYRGLYVHLENPDDDWMDRTQMDKEGWLWKSYSEAKGGTGGFEMEEDAGNPAAANAALGSFISNMNNLSGQSLDNYIQGTMNVEGFIDFLAVHQLTHDADHPAKNYLVYADEDAPAGTWTYLLWDADLSHGRNYECSACAFGGGVYNDCIRWDFWGDSQLLFGTSARPKCDGPWNGVIHAFLGRTQTFRPDYYARVEELLDVLYYPDVLKPLIDEMAGPLAAEVALDWQRNPPQYGRNNSPGDYLFHVNELSTWVDNRYAYLASALAELTTPDVSDLECTREDANALLSWSNNAPYDSIRVYRNGAVYRTIAGTATSTTVPLDLGTTLNSFRVASVIGGRTRPGETCSILVSSGGYAEVINEGFSPPAPVGELSVNCEAQQTNGVLQLTEPSGSQAGSAFFTTPFPMDDFIADFDVRFDDPSAQGADGMAFILNTGDQTGICGGAGGALGYFDRDGGVPVFPGYAVVLDTWQNAGEPSHNWIGFVDTRAQAFPVVAVDVPEELNGQGSFHCKLLGKAGTFTLLVSNVGIGMAEREIFTHTVGNFSGGDAYFGFSAGTGGAVARHIVDNFVLQINTGSQEPPTADFSANVVEGPIPLQVTFTNLSTNADTYSWSFGDGGTSSSRNPVHTFDEAGTYTVSLTARGPGGSDTVTKTGLIKTYAPVTASFVATNNLGSAPLRVQFVNQSTGARSYQWDFGDGFTSTLASPAHTYSSGGQYTVRLVARGDPGVEDTMTRTNYVQVDDPIVADFTATPTAGEAPLTVRFTDRSSGSTIQSWLWDFGDGSTSTQENPTHSYATNGAYSVSLQVFGFASGDTEVKVGLVRVGPTGGGIFIRGDTNGDMTVDISDPIATLNYLFLGSAEPDCLDAADVDDSGEVDITDPIRVLNFLFQGGEAPNLPYPGPGTDPTDDGLRPCTRT